MELRFYQKAAIDAVYDYLRHENGNPCVVLPTGCHAKDHPILMHDGTLKPVQDVVVGDLIMGPDSKPRQVLSLCRGKDEMFQIRPVKGTPFVVNGDHVLSLVCTNEGKKASNFPCYKHGGEIENITVREYLTKSKSWKHLRKLYHVGVDFDTTVDLPIPPYILGLLLGDGCLRNTVELATADLEIEKSWNQYVQSLGYEVGIDESRDRCPTFRISETPKGRNLLRKVFEEMHLDGQLSGTKFIPQPYLTASRQERFLLLAGILDADGHLGSGYFDYVTKSVELAADVVFLARSLGFHVCSRMKYVDGNFGAGWFYRVGISGDVSNIPCRLERKQSPKRRQKKDVLRTGFSVESVGVDDYYGFTLDGDHLYVDGHFMVHHNSGKTPLLATICSDAVTKWNGRVLVLSHVKELLQQAADKLQLICPDVKVGVYSAGLKSRETDAPVIVAGIQSVYKKACELDRFDLIIVDECHLIPPPRHSYGYGKRPTGADYCNGAEAPTGRPPTDPPDGEGMYQTFLKEAKLVNPHVRLIGLTATPYRMKSGTLVGPDNLLNHICYEIGVKELIEQGFLCPLRSKSGRHKINCNDLHIRAGEFVQSEVDQLMNTTDNVDAAVREIVSQTKDRNSVLIFGVSVDHATRIKETIERFTSQECGLVTGDTPSVERDKILRRFKGQRAVGSQMELPLLYDNPLPSVAGIDERNNVKRIIEREAYRDETASFPLKYLVNVNVLTTGFDAPNVDCVVLLRPTASPGLFYQMVGRSFRIHPSKQDALVLDYGGNILRHGPVDAIQIAEKQGRGGGDAPAKECPECLALIHAALRVCPDCGYEFPEPDKEKHDAMASNEGILSGEITDTEYDVETVYYHVHTKRGATESDPRTLRVDYSVGFNQYQSEWVCPEHSGWARKKFEKWWTDRSNDPPPDDAEQAVRLAEAGSLSIPMSIVVRKVGGEKFDRIIKYTLPPHKPPAVGELPETDNTQFCGTCTHCIFEDDFSLGCRLGHDTERSSECQHYSFSSTDDVPF